MKNNTIRFILVGLIAIAALYLILDHGQHTLPYLPFAFLLGCLFMHLFMHGGHGAHGDHHTHDHAQDDTTHGT